MCPTTKSMRKAWSFGRRAACSSSAFVRDRIPAKASLANSPQRQVAAAALDLEQEHVVEVGTGIGVADIGAGGGPPV